MSATEGTIRVCDHPGCDATYNAAAVMTGQASATGWIQNPSRGEHYCPDHHHSPALAALIRLVDQYGSDWHLTLADQPGRWAEQDLRDVLTGLPTTSGIWRRMAVEILAVLDAEEATRADT